MAPLVKLLNDGRKILLSRNGNQTIMQIVDSLDNVVFTRCKSIKTMTVPVIQKKDTVRTTIGFVPQKLRSHHNDRTVRQIGFLAEGQVPTVRSTSAPKFKHIFQTKTDFGSNMDIINISNSERKYDIAGKLVSFTKQNVPTDDISRLQLQQQEILMSSTGEYNALITRYDDAFKMIDTSIQDMQKQLASYNEYNLLLNQGVQKNKENMEAVTKALMFNEISKKILFNDAPKMMEEALSKLSKPNLAKEVLEEVATMKTSTILDDNTGRIGETFQKLHRQYEDLQQKLIKCEEGKQRVFEEINTLEQQATRANIAKCDLKMRYESAEKGIRKQLFALQKQITALFAKSSLQTA